VDVTRIGPYPYAVFLPEALSSAAKDFKSIRRSLEHAQIRERVDYDTRRPASLPPSEKQPQVEELMLKQLQQLHHDQVQTGEETMHQPIETTGKWWRKSDLVSGSMSKVPPFTTRTRARDLDDATLASEPIAKRARMGKADGGSARHPLPSRDFPTLELPEP